jgi:transcriptional regulator with PAS, ATPase and Fis domain
MICTPSGVRVEQTLSKSEDLDSAGLVLRSAPLLVLLLEAERPTAGGSRHILSGLTEVVVGRGSSREHERDTRKGTLSIRVADPWMSSTHARMLCGLGKVILEDRGSRNGTLVNGRPIDRHELHDGDVVEIGRTFFLYRASATVAHDDFADVDTSGLSPPVTGLTTFEPTLGRDFAGLARVALGGLAILIQGETGTGKELVARGVHTLSQRGVFVPVNCGAIPQTLVESELFGSRKGAYSGAADERPGLVRSADGGTLFLDEIGDLPLVSQAALLRLLQEKEVTPVGGTRAIKVDVRFVAATHRNLDTLVAEGRFRADLFARLRGYVVTAPPVRERREDLGLLIQGLLVRDSTVVRFGCEALRALLRYRYPLNVRELDAILSSAALLAGNDRIRLDHLPEPVRTGEAAPPPTESSATVDDPVDLARKEELIALLEKHGGNLSAVAREMEKDRVQIRRWTKRFGLDAGRFRDE